MKLNLRVITFVLCLSCKLFAQEPIPPTSQAQPTTTDVPPAQPTPLTSQAQPTPLTSQAQPTTTDVPPAQPTPLTSQVQPTTTETPPTDTPIADEKQLSLLTFEPYPDALKNEVIVLQPKEGYHFNLEAPNQCGEQDFVYKSIDEMDCQITTTKQKLLVSICDDQKTMCKQEKFEISSVHTVEVQAPAKGKVKGAPKATLKTIPKKLSPGFTSDLEEALAKAKKSKQLLFVDHTSENCPPCKMLEEKVFSTPEFQKRTKDLIKVAADAYDTPTQEKLIQFKLRGTPTMLLLNSNGEEIGRIVGSDVTPKLLAKIDALKKFKDEPIQMAKIKFEEMKKQGITLKDPKFVELSARLGLWYYDANQMAEAKEILASVQEQNDELRVHWMLAQLEIEDKKDDIQTYQKWVETLQQDSYAQKEYFFSVYRFYKSLAGKYKSKKMDAQGLANVAKNLLTNVQSLQKDFDAKNKDYDLDDLQNIEASLHEDLKNDKDVKSIKEKLLVTLDHEIAEATKSKNEEKKIALIANKASALVDLGKEEEAKKLIQELVTKYPQDYKAMREAFYFYGERKDYVSADTVSDKALKLATGNQVMDAKLNKAQASINLNKQEDAKKWIKEVQDQLDLPLATASWLHGFAKRARRLLAKADGKLPT